MLFQLFHRGSKSPGQIQWILARKAERRTLAPAVQKKREVFASPQKSTFNSWYLFHGQPYSGQNSFAPLQPLLPGTPLRTTASAISSKAERVRSVACSSR